MDELIDSVQNGKAPGTVSFPVSTQTTGMPLTSLSVRPFNPLAPAPRNDGLNSTTATSGSRPSTAPAVSCGASSRSSRWSAPAIPDPTSAGPLTDASLPRDPANAGGAGDPECADVILQCGIVRRVGRGAVQIAPGARSRRATPFGVARAAGARGGMPMLGGALPPRVG
jgi:hypothetical protein